MKYLSNLNFQVLGDKFRAKSRARSSRGIGSGKILQGHRFGQDLDNFSSGFELTEYNFIWINRIIYIFL
jgi:hypothetical protein